MNAYPSRAQAVEQILDIGVRMERRGYVVGNDGNISCLLAPDRVLATPTGVSKGKMMRDMLSVLDLAGNVVEAGSLPVSSEVKMHLRVYMENPDLHAVVHAHPVTATSFAAAGIALDEPILTEAVTAVGSIPVAHFAMPGTSEVPDSIAPFCTKYNGALLANHGVITWATELEQAFFRLEWTEMIAKCTLITKYVIGQYHRLSEEQAQRFGPLREKLGIPLGGAPLYAQQAVNTEDVLPRSGPAPASEADTPLVEAITRRVTQSVLTALEQAGVLEKPEA